LFGENDVSIDSVIQKKYCEGKADLVLITEKVQDRNLKKAIEQIKGLEPVHALENMIRVEKES
jgi:homoserine dehydrogenase